MTFDLVLIVSSLPRLLEGLGLTAALLVISLAMSAPLAALAALAVMRGGAASRHLALGYLWVFRGTPALVQLFVVYYGLAQFEAVRESPAWVLLREPFWCCVLVFALNSGAYTAEILRGAISAVDKMQLEAARALGLGPRRGFFLVVWPQAMRLALRPYTNEVIGMLKTTALASTVTLTDITGVAETIASETFAPYELFLSAAIIYLAIAWAIQKVMAIVDSSLSYPAQ